MEDRNDEETLEDIKALRDLLESRGWSILEKLIKREIQARTDKVMLEPRGSIEDEWNKEYMKGEAAFGRFILSIPSIEIETADAIKEAQNDDPDTTYDQDSSDTE